MPELSRLPENETDKQSVDRHIASTKLSNDATQSLSFGKESSFLETSEHLLQKMGAASFSKSNMARAIRDPQIVGTESEVLAALYSTYFHYQGYSSPVHIRNSINRRDLNAIDSDITRTQEVVSNQDRVRDYLSRVKDFDTNKVALSKTNFEDRLRSTNDAYDRDTLRMILRDFDNVAALYTRPSGPTSRGISLEEMKNYPLRAVGEKAALAYDFMRQSEQEFNDDKRNSRSLYGMENPAQSIVPEAVKLAFSRNNGSFHAGLIAMARSHPERIEQMISQNADGSFKVKFPGLSKELNVAAPTETELAVFDRNTQHGYWPAVLDKAYGAYLRSGITGSWEKTPQEAVDAESTAKSVMRLFSGQSPWSFSTQRTDQQVGNVISAALKENVAMIATAPQSWHDSDGKYIPRGTQAVVGFDATAPDGGTITLMDPANPTKPLKINMLRFKTYFPELVGQYK